MVGIDISDRSIKVTEIVGDGDPQLRSVCWAPVAAEAIQRGFIRDVPMVTRQLEQAFARCSPKPVESNMVVASIPEMQSFVRVIDLPMMTDREMDEAVQWGVRQHLPFDLERVYLDWQVISPPVRNVPTQQVLVGAAQKEVVDPLLTVLDALGLRVMALELEAQAIVRSLLPLGAHGVRGVLIVDLGAVSTNVVYFDQGTMRFTTSVQSGGDDLTWHLAQSLKLEESVAAEKKALIGVSAAASDQQVASVLRQATRDLVQRVERVVSEITARSLKGGLREILLTGGAANLQGIIEVFAEVFPGVPVQIGNPWTNLVTEEEEDKAPLSTADAAHFATSLGLALRRFDNS